MINWLKQKNRTVQLRDEILSEIVAILGETLISMISFGTETSLKELTGMDSSLMIVVTEINHSLFNNISPLLNELTNESPMLISGDELTLFPLNYPLEIVHIKNDYSILYGYDCIESLQIESESLKTTLQKELFSLILNLRTVVLEKSGNPDIGVAVLCRFLLIGEGLLEFRNIPVPTSWGSLVTEIESCYSVKEFALAEMIAALENSNDADLTIYLPSLLIVLEEILDVISVQGEGV